MIPIGYEVLINDAGEDPMPHGWIIAYDGPEYIVRMHDGEVYSFEAWDVLPLNAGLKRLVDRAGK